MPNNSAKDRVVLCCTPSPGCPNQKEVVKRKRSTANCNPNMPHASTFLKFQQPKENVYTLIIYIYTYIPPLFPQTSPQPSRMIVIWSIRIFDIGCYAFGISAQVVSVEPGIPQISQVSEAERKDSTAVPPSSSAGAAPRGRKICHLAANSSGLNDEASELVVSIKSRKQSYDWEV